MKMRSPCSLGIATHAPGWSGRRYDVQPRCLALEPMSRNSVCVMLVPLSGGRKAADERLSSAAASAPQQVCQKTNDLARAAVGCNDGFGGLAAVVRVLPASAHHPGTESRGTTGVRWNHTSMESPAARNHAGIPGVGWNHPQHTITPGTTGTQHHEPSNHASTTGTCTTRIAQRAFENRVGWTRKKACRPRCYSRRTVEFSAASAPQRVC